MSLSNAETKIAEAVYSMATSARDLRYRLETAAVTLIQLHEDELPEGDLRDRFYAVRHELTKFPGKEGDIQETLRNLDDEELHDVAEMICNLHSAVVLEITEGSD